MKAKPGFEALDKESRALVVAFVLLLVALLIPSL